MEALRRNDLDQQGLYFEDLSVGMTASFSKTVTEADIVLFSGISGDTNPVHLDQRYAERTMFKGRISHGLLSASFISAVLGTKIPGPGAIYISQSLRFKAPVRPGDTVTARATITELMPDKRRAIMVTECLVDDKAVIEGEAIVMVPSRP